MRPPSRALVAFSVSDMYVPLALAGTLTLLILLGTCVWAAIRAKSKPFILIGAGLALVSMVQPTWRWLFRFCTATWWRSTYLWPAALAVGGVTRIAGYALMTVGVVSLAKALRSRSRQERVLSQADVVSQQDEEGP